MEEYSLLCAISITEKRLNRAMDIDNSPALELHEAELNRLNRELNKVRGAKAA